MSYPRTAGEAMDAGRCPICGDTYGLVQERDWDGYAEYEPVWCATCHAWHENVYKDGAFVGTETNLDEHDNGAWDMRVETR